jgi:hypothetical protein
MSETVERRVQRHGRRRSTAQSMVEFALVLSIALPMILGIISFSYVGFLDASVSNGARAGARSALLSTPPSGSETASPQTAYGGLYVWNGSRWCESGTPGLVAASVAQGAIMIKVDTTEPFCDYGAYGTKGPTCRFNCSPPPNSAAECMTQAGVPSGDAVLTLCPGIPSNPQGWKQNPTGVTAVTLGISYNVQGLAPPLAASFPISVTSYQQIFPVACIPPPSLSTCPGS